MCCEGVHTVLDSKLSPPEAGPLSQAVRFDRRSLITAVALGVFATLLSTMGSWIPSFWGDEAASIMSAQRPLSSLFMMTGHVDAVHGTYYLFLHFWINLFGASPFSVRLPPALAVGIAAVGVFVLARRLGGYRVALFAGLIFAFLPRVTYMGEETRSYAMSAAGAVWLTVLLVRLIARNERRILPWAGYSVLLAVSGYLFLFTLLILAAHAVILWSVTRERRMLRTWLAASVAGIVLVSPLIYWAYRERNQISYLAGSGATAPNSLIVDQWFGNVGYAILAWAMVLIVLVLAWIAWRRRRSGTAAGYEASILTPAAPGLPSMFIVSASFMFIPPVLLLLANFASAVYTVRYMSFATPGVALMLAFAVTLPKRRWISIVALVLLIAAAVPTYVFERTPYAKNASDWAQAASVVAAHASPGDAVVFDEGTQPSKRLRLALHTYPAAFKGLKDVTLKVPYYKNTWWWDTFYKVPAVADRFTNIKTVWLLEYKYPGKPADTYGMADLKQLGYTVTKSFTDERSVVYELTK
ncbi:MAG: mannosyltransferase [Microbacteriaceae bacterium]|jgi:mannosyltransferase|nr:mannosyltransferase [Microbacteriaceae bacterium]